MRIAVISDIHAAADALGAALAAARDEGFDQLIILGDLLTYGVHPQETLEHVQQAVDVDRAILIRGNHDQIYLDRERGRASYELTLPDWIRESVDWTCTRLSSFPAPALSAFDWRDDWESDGLFAAHANPFLPRNWSYLRDDADRVAARDTLAARGFRAGIFGHTHRYGSHESDGVSAVTVGSIGQPRDQARTSEWTLVEWTKGEASVGRRRVEVDWPHLISAVRTTGLSDRTKDRICRFYG